MLEYTHIAFYKDGYWYVVVLQGGTLGVPYTDCYYKDLPKDLVEVYRDGGVRFMVKK